MKIPAGYCQCGCGQKTSIVTQRDPKRGYEVGDYKRFVNHHHCKAPRKYKTCAICGKKFKPVKFSRQENQLSCSGPCRNTFIARKYASKQAETKRHRGEGKSYTKYHGSHEHRVVMEQVLGRKLSSDEIVHHKDGNIHNNDADNLQVITRSEHALIHLHNQEIKETECDYNAGLYGKSTRCC